MLSCVLLMVLMVLSQQIIMAILVFSDLDITIKEMEALQR